MSKVLCSDEKAARYMTNIKGSPISRDFWESLTIDELAESQNVKPMMDVRALFGTWPGEEDDGFEEAINELRHRNTAEGKML